jgi:type IV pilus assembly protein PilY1
MDGLVTYDTGTQAMNLKPYSMKGKVTAYDETTSTVTVDIQASDIAGPSAGGTFTLWQVVNESNPAIGNSASSVSMSAGSKTFVLEPAGAWVAVDDIMTFSTRNMVGLSGEKMNGWDIQCLQDSAAIGETYANNSLVMTNSGESDFTVENVTGDFSTCTAARMSSYDMQGTAEKSYTDWHVNNLTTKVSSGKSSSPLTLSESGVKSFSVIPALNWLTPGDLVQVSNYSSEAQELYTIGYLWNGREQLTLPGVTDAMLASNRAYGTSASSGRFIKTWVDTDLDGRRAESDEYRAFEAGMIDDASGVKHGFFDVDTEQVAKDTVNYIRGIEVAGTRNRTLKYSESDLAAKVLRLGDIINSTPTVVGSPQEAFNFLYGDDSYAAFRTQYQSRRIMAYTGANDGLLHAFNGGFFVTVGLDENGNEVELDDPSVKSQAVKYAIEGKNCQTGAAAVPHPLGSEIWAYAPMNLLPHLQWLKDSNYKDTHVYFMDGKPRVFDANIFKVDTEHPGGWGTVLVVGMNLGGGTMEVDTKSDDDGTAATISDNVNMRSAYIVFDITNPEEEPELLGEIRTPDNSFSTVYPAVAAFRDKADNTCNGENGACNKWYLIFGTGPNDLDNYTSTQSAKLHLFDLSQLTTSNSVAVPALGAVVPAGCVVNPMTDAEIYNVITCDTLYANHFVGTPVVVDWDMDFFSDTSYFGLVGGATDATVTPPQGGIMRFGFNDEANPDKWSSLSSLYLTNQSIVAQPTVGVDNKDNKWVFFGTGRYFTVADKSSTATQSLFGIKDDESNTTVNKTTLLNVTDVEVYTDGSLNQSLSGTTATTLSSFNDIVNEIDINAKGWLLDLPPISGTAGTAPSTRNVTRSALLGGALFTSVYQPSDDPCTGEGLSRLYGLYYKTGTAMPGPAVLGTNVEEVGGKLKYRSLKYLDLGRGLATAPAIHSGSGTGEGSLSVFTQLSTGDVVEKTAETPQNVRTGRMSWKEE